MMDSGSGGNDSESSSYNHRKGPFHQSCSSNKNDHKNPLLITRSKSIIRRTIYFIAFASACFLLYLALFNRDQYYLPISDDDPLSRQSQNSTKSSHSSLPRDDGKFSAPTDEFFQVNSTPVSNSSSPGHPSMHDFLLVNSTHFSNISTPVYAPPPKDSFLQGNSSSNMYDPTDDFIQENSDPASNNSSPMHAPANDFIGGNSSSPSEFSSPTYAPEKLATPVSQSIRRHISFFISGLIGFLMLSN